MTRAGSPAGSRDRIIPAFRVLDRPDERRPPLARLGLDVNRRHYFFIVFTVTSQCLSVFTNGRRCIAPRAKETAAHGERLWLCHDSEPGLSGDETAGYARRCSWYHKVPHSMWLLLGALRAAGPEAAMFVTSRDDTPGAPYERVVRRPIRRSGARGPTAGHPGGAGMEAFDALGADEIVALLAGRAGNPGALKRPGPAMPWI